MKSALVTGANKGIGLEVSKILAKQGIHVFIGCRGMKNGVAAVAQLHAEGLTNAEAVQLDVQSGLS